MNCCTILAETNILVQKGVSCLECVVCCSNDQRLISVSFWKVSADNILYQLTEMDSRDERETWFQTEEATPQMD